MWIYALQENVNSWYQSLEQLSTLGNKEFELEIDKNSQFIFEYFERSLISGEYIRNEEFQKYLEQIEQKISQLQQLSTNLSEDGLVYFQNFIQTIRTAVLKIKLFTIYVLMSQTQDQIIYESSKVNQPIIVLKNFNDLLNRFDKHLEICKIDHSLTANKTTFHSLLNIKRDISLFHDPLSTLFREKCHFLLKKIAYRLQEAKLKYKILEDETVVELDFHSTDLDNLSSINTALERYYYEGDWQNSTIHKGFLKSVKQTFKSNESSVNDFLIQLQFGFKYYKDVIKSTYKINELYSIFTKFVKSINSIEFDKDVYNLAHCYFGNYKLSSYISLSDQVSKKEIEECLQEIISLHHEYEIPNFFPFKKACQFYLAQITELFKNEPELKLKELNNYISQVEKYFIEYRERLEICSEKRFLQFRLPLAESGAHGLLEEEDIFIYVYSGHVVPLNYISENENFLKIQSEIIKFKSMYEIACHMKKSKDDIDYIKSQVEKSERSSIEILGIFSAVVLFAFGSLDIFNKTSSIEEAILFSVFFAFSLITFVLAIWFVTRQTLAKIRLIHWVIAAVIFVLWAILLFKFLL